MGSDTDAVGKVYNELTAGAVAGVLGPWTT